MKGIGTNFNIISPFKPIGALKTGCINCEGCTYEFYSFTAYPCSVCSHNVRNRNISNCKNYYEKKNRKTI